MRIKGSLAWGVLFALSLALLPVSAASAQNVIPGSACKVLKQKVVHQNKTHTCVKSGKKLIWNKGVAAVKPAPASKPVTAPTPAPTPTASSTPDSIVTLTATPTPASELEAATPAATCSRNKNALKNC
jgi:hypothetical protein